MFHLDICVVAVILTSTSALDLCSDPHGGPCKKTNKCEPSVTPKNSTHLLVNWENVFEEGCESHIKKMEIVILEKKSTEKRKAVSLSQKESVVLANPCLAHIVRIELFLTDSYSGSYGRNNLRSPSIEYNKIERESEKYPFGGLLITTVVPKICLKANGTIVIQRPPEALKNCEIKSGNVKSGELKDSDFDEVGASGTVKFTFKNPQSPNTRTYQNYLVKDIQDCASDDSDSLVIIVTVIITLIALGLISTIAIICWKKQGKAKSRELNREVDANPVYGIYALNDEGEDVGLTEFKDTNDYYVM